MAEKVLAIAGSKRGRFFDRVQIGENHPPSRHLCFQEKRVIQAVLDTKMTEGHKRGRLGSSYTAGDSLRKIISLLTYQQSRYELNGLQQQGISQNHSDLL